MTMALAIIIINFNQLKKCNAQSKISLLIIIEIKVCAFVQLISLKKFFRQQIQLRKRAKANIVHHYTGI